LTIEGKLNKIAWIVIWLVLILLAVWTVWAGRQSEVRSIWAP
jgi:glucan phosphoethanolaminetransferase (alkaline phosphatase superfamily)